MANLESEMIECASYGDLEGVERLLKLGVNVRSRDDQALRWASMNGHIKIVELLLEAGANVHAVDDGALCWASRYGRNDVVDALLSAGADVHARHDKALDTACFYNQRRTVIKLVEAGASLKVLQRGWVYMFGCTVPAGLAEASTGEAVQAIETEIVRKELL